MPGQEQANTALDSWELWAGAHQASRKCYGASFFHSDSCFNSLGKAKTTTVENMTLKAPLEDDAAR